MPKRPTISELRKRYVTQGHPLPREVEAALRDDPRAGAQEVLAAVERRRRANRAEGQRLRHLLTFEQSLWSEGFERIAGVDEAGMSPLAGPVAAAAVILPRDVRIRGIDDSKKLRPEEREALAEAIRGEAVAWSIAFVEAEEIDRINIYRAGLLVMQRAVLGLATQPDALLVDARRLPELPLPQRNIVKGDAKSLSIAAASILAKTARDRRMVELDAAYPGYGFARHKGYPVPEHLSALEKLGATPIHRRSFAPVQQALGLRPQQIALF